MSEPRYCSEYVGGAQDVLLRFLVPALPKNGLDAAAVGRALEPFTGHHMAKSVLETAVLDAQLQLSGESFRGYVGACRGRVPCGVFVGIMDSIPELLDAVEGYVAEGYVRIKLKIEPGSDVEPVRAVRERFGEDLLLQADANAAYTLVDAQQLAKLDTPVVRVTAAVTKRVSIAALICIKPATGLGSSIASTSTTAPPRAGGRASPRPTTQTCWMPHTSNSAVRSSWSGAI